MAKAAENGTLELDEEGHPIIRDENGAVEAGIAHFDANMLMASTSRRVALYIRGDPRRIQFQETLVRHQQNLTSDDVDIIPAILVGGAADVSSYNLLLWARLNLPTGKHSALPQSHGGRRLRS